MDEVPSHWAICGEASALFLASNNDKEPRPMSGKVEPDGRREGYMHVAKKMNFGRAQVEA